MVNGGSLQPGDEVIHGRVEEALMAVIVQQGRPHFAKRNQAMDHAPENKRIAPGGKRSKSPLGDPLFDHGFDQLENPLTVPVDLLFDGWRENNVGGRQKILDHFEIILVPGAEFQIGGGHAGKFFRRRGHLLADGQNVAMKDIEPLGLQGRKDILLVFKIEIDGANAQFGGPCDLIDGGQGKALLQ